MSLETYLAASGIDPVQFTAEFYAQLAQFQQDLDKHLSSSQPTLQWQYQVPELGEGGACSLFGQLAESRMIWRTAWAAKRHRTKRCCDRQRRSWNFTGSTRPATGSESIKSA